MLASIVSAVLGRRAARRTPLPVSAAPGAAATPSDPWAALDALLLADYDPASSRAWAGAAPRAGALVDASIDPSDSAIDPARGTNAARRGRAVRQLELDFTPLPTPTFDDADAAARRAHFRARGVVVRAITGEGAKGAVDDFCARHHYLMGGGMNGDRFGLYATRPADAGPTEGPAAGPGAPALVEELVGVAVFAPCQNTKTAAGMRAADTPEDAALAPAARAHVWFGEDEYRDCVRLCLAEATAGGVALGTGAESHFYAECLRWYVERNRMLWRAVRWAELLATGGGPCGAARPAALPATLPAWAEALLADAPGWVKCVRTFADPRVGHAGTIYQAAGAWYLGQTRVEARLVGRRSGEGLTRRALSKLLGDGQGHTHQVLRAVWEGGAGTAELHDRATGAVVAVLALDGVRTAVPDGLAPTQRERALKQAWRTRRAAWHAALAAQGIDAGDAARFDERLAADDAGYEAVAAPAKHRYAHFLAARPGIAHQMARRCRYLRTGILQAEAAWYVAHPRGGRGHGYNYPRRPPRLGAPPYPLPLPA